MKWQPDPRKVGRIATPMLSLLTRSWRIETRNEARWRGLVDAKRPNGGTRSFPSGHTSFSFAGAEFIRKEYGWGWGTPALLVAGFVGWSRVQADQHYTRDVLAGAAIGVLANHDFWRRKSRAGSLAFAPAMLESGRTLTPGLAFELKIP